MRFSYESLPPSDKILTAAASIAGFLFLMKSIANDLIPERIQTYFASSLDHLSTKLWAQLTVVIDEFDGLISNQMFDAANVYLSSKISGATRRIKVIKPSKEQDLSVTVDKNQEITDVHGKIQFKWILNSSTVKHKAKNDNLRSKLRYLELSFNKKHRDYAVKVYLPYILGKAKEMKRLRL